jgi:hypothetical protein
MHSSYIDNWSNNKFFISCWIFSQNEQRKTYSVSVVFPIDISQKPDYDSTIAQRLEKYLTSTILCKWYTNIFYWSSNLSHVNIFLDIIQRKIWQN